SFEVAPGELLGYIGPNGAGKSTTVKILGGILVPDAGIVEVDGLVPWEQRVEHVKRIGVVFGQRTQLWWDLPVIESFELLRHVYDTEASAHAAMQTDLVDLLDLAPILDTPVRQLSLGQRMRCDLVAALLHSPPLLFLDEPTIGLDAVAKLAVRDFIRRLHDERGTTVVLTTHDMDDIDALCTRLLLIGSGKILHDGSLDDLRRLVHRDRRLVIDVSSEAEAGKVEDPDAEIVTRQGHRVTLQFDPERIPAAQLISRLASRYALHDLVVEAAPIEEVIAAVYRREHRS
ncbi:MAG: ATP-binding cassette domain-containing protein, partial [Gemmatimonadetes bacterium]|nr:ATP-binding cassette domain-containing protein [Gemmatimonadota bacterium]